MITKTKVQEQIDKLPEEFSIDELVERLIFIEKIEKGLEQSAKGEVLTESELDENLSKWFK